MGSCYCFSFVFQTASLGSKLTTTSRCASLSKAHNKAVTAHSFLTFTRPRRGVLPVSWKNTSKSSPGRGIAKKLFQGENWLRKKRGSTQMRRIFSLLACPVSRCQWTQKIHVARKGKREETAALQPGGFVERCRRLRRHCFFYPSSHNHGSVKNGCISNRIVSFHLVGEITHFHEYGSFRATNLLCCKRRKSTESDPQTTGADCLETKKLG